MCYTMYDLFLFRACVRESLVAASGGFCGRQTGRQGRHFPMAVSQPSGQAVAARIFCARRDQGLRISAHRVKNRLSKTGDLVGIQINSARHMQKIEIIGVRKTRDIFNPFSKCLVKS